MTDLSITVQPSRQQLAAIGRSAPAKVTGKLRIAIEAMVWLALPRKQAAEHAGITEHGLYKALRKAPVRAYYLSELDVLRTSERARNIHRLVAIREAADNMPAVNAIKMLEQIDEQTQAHSGANQRVPGMIIQIIGAPAPAASMRDITPTPQPLSQHERDMVLKAKQVQGRSEWGADMQSAGPDTKPDVG